MLNIDPKKETITSFDTMDGQHFIKGEDFAFATLHEYGIIMKKVDYVGVRLRGSSFFPIHTVAVVHFNYRSADDE